MTKASDNVFPRFLVSEGGSTTTPAAGQVTIYAKADGLLYQKDDAGAETLLAGGSAGAVATDAIWDAAGDLAVGSGANTAARLAIGSAGGAVSRVNGAVAWNSGTAFPTAATGDRFWRTDTGLEYYFDGTRWVSVQLFAMSPTAATALAALSASSNVGRIGTEFGTGTDLWLVNSMVKFFVASGGSALSGSHSWICTIVKLDTANNSGGTLDTITVNSGNSAEWRTETTAIGALLGTSATYPAINFSWAKTGTPGTLTPVHTLTCRLVQT